MSLQVIPELASCLENWSAGVRVPRQRLRCVGGVVRMRGVRHMQAVVRRFRLDVGVHGWLRWLFRRAFSCFLLAVV